MGGALLPPSTLSLINTLFAEGTGATGLSRCGAVTGGVTMAVFVLVQGPELGWAAPAVLAASALAVALLVAFAVSEARSADPPMPPRLLRNRGLLAAVVITFVCMATFGALPYFPTVLLQTVHAFSALRTDLAFLVPSAAIALGTQLGAPLAGGSVPGARCCSASQWRPCTDA
jgi:predicted MFS family arabinose efflux permease